MKKQPAEHVIKQAKVIQLKVRKPKNPFFDLANDLEEINQRLDNHWKNELKLKPNLSILNRLKMLFKIGKIHSTENVNSLLSN